MKHLKQPIAWRVNREDNCTGHFFESRVYSGALLSEQAVLATTAYVDLNPVRPKFCDTIESDEHTSIYRRLQHLETSPEQLHEMLKPLESGLGNIRISSVCRITISASAVLAHFGPADQYHDRH